MFSNFLNKFIKYGSSEVPPIKAEKIFIDVIDHILCIAVSIYTAQPVLKVPDLFVQHKTVSFLFR